MDLKRQRDFQVTSPTPVKRRREGSSPNTPIRIYTQGIFDMFHHGHMRFLENCKKRFQHVHLIVGIVSDEDLSLNEKGVIIMSQKERSDAVMYCKWVDQIISPCDWVISAEFLQEELIDFVCYDNSAYNLGIRLTDSVYDEIRESNKLLPCISKENINTNDLVLRIVKDYDKFVKRNIMKNYPREQMGISLGKELLVKAEAAAGKIWKRVSRWFIGDEEEASKVRQTFNRVVGIVGDWEDSMEEAVEDFLDTYNLGYHQFMRKITVFK